MPYHKHNFKYRRVTLPADDLVSEHGIVSMRVGFALRSAEIKPLFISVSQNLKKEFQRDVFSQKKMIVDDFLDSDHIILERRVYRLWLENTE